MKTLVFYAAPPVFLIICWFFYRLVTPRVPADSARGWRIFSIGLLIAIAGLSLAVYFDRIDDGAAIAMFGIIVGACGLFKFLKDRQSNH